MKYLLLFILGFTLLTACTKDEIPDNAIASEKSSKNIQHRAQTINHLDLLIDCLYHTCPKRFET